MRSGGDRIVRDPTDPLARTTPLAVSDVSGTGAQRTDAPGAQIIDGYTGPRGASQTRRPWWGRRAIDAIINFFRRNSTPAPEIVFEEPGRFSRVSTVPMTPGQLPGTTLLEARSGAVVSYFEKNNVASIFSANPYDIAQMLYVIESAGRQLHRSLSFIINAILNSERTIIAGSFVTKPVYGENLRTYYADLRPVDASMQMPAMQTFAQRFIEKTQREIVDTASSPENPNPSIEDIRKTLLSVFDRAYHQYAVSRANADGKIAAMNLMRGMISTESSDQRFGSFISISEAGVGLDETGAVNRFVLRFYKGPTPAADAEVDPNKLITLIGMPDETDPEKMHWFVFDSGEFFQMSQQSRALQGIISDVLRDLFLRGTFFGFFSGTVLKKDGGGQNGPGGAAPTSSGTPGAVPPAAAPPVSQAMPNSALMSTMNMQTQLFGAMTAIQGTAAQMTSMGMFPLMRPVF